tara:strand:+ start:1290 stop:1856 length:567 start_codon:yes stop_codon:yes gene_type:complete
MIKLKLILFIIIILISKLSIAKETWILDNELSTINFEIPVFLAKNVKGEFKEMQGIIEIDKYQKNNNKAIFSVKIESMEINYSEYKDLLMSDIFFNEIHFPVALLDTKKFLYDNEKKLKINVELIIKNISKNIPLKIDVVPLTKDLVQIKGELEFSRNKYKIGEGRWSSTAILKDKVLVTTDLFFFKK